MLLKEFIEWLEERERELEQVLEVTTDNRVEEFAKGKIDMIREVKSKIENIEIAKKELIKEIVNKLSEL